MKTKYPNLNFKYLNAQSKQWRNLLFQVVPDHTIYLFHICCQLLLEQQSRVLGFNLVQSIHLARELTIGKRKIDPLWTSTETLNRNYCTLSDRVA